MLPAITVCAVLLTALSANPGLAQRLDSQFTDDIGIDQRLPTLKYNGYQGYVADLYP